MRLDVADDSRQRLQLTLRTNVPLYAIFGLMFVGMGLVCIRLLAVEARIVVEQQRFSYASTCVWILDCGAAQAAAQDVRSVALVGHEIQVQLPDGAHRLALPQSDGDEKAAIARDIQVALQRPDASFRHVEGSPLAGLLLGLVCIGSGLVILIAIQRVSLSADRDAGKLTLTRRLLLWPIVQRHDLNLADIEAVHVIPSTLRTGRHIVTSWSVGLQTRGRSVDDSIRVTFLPMFTERAATQLAQILRTWIAASAG